MQLSPIKVTLLRLLSKHGSKSTEELAHIAANEIPLYAEKTIEEIKKAVSVQLSQICAIKVPHKKDATCLERVFKIKTKPNVRGGSCRYCVYTISTYGIDFLQDLDKKDVVSKKTELPRVNSVFALGGALVGKA